MRRFLLLSCCLAALAVNALSAQDIVPWHVLDARSAALGGKHVALADDESVLLLNPAGLGFVPTGLTLSRVCLGLSGPIFEAAGMAIEGGTTNVLSGLSSLFDSSGRLYASADLVGPVNAVFVSKGFGVGLFNRTRTIIDASSLASIDVAAIEDIYLSVGYGHAFKLGRGMELGFGAAAKGFTTRAIGVQTDILGLSAIIQDAGSLADTAPLAVISGFSLDAGVRFSAWNGRFAMGIAGTDAFGIAWAGLAPSLNGFLADPFAAPSGNTSDILPDDISVGFLVNPPLGILDRYVTGLRLMADYSSILSLFDALPPNPILLASVGAEVTFHDILHVRAGIGEGLLAAGFGLDLTIFDLDVAMFGRELGREPGSRPVYNLTIDLSFKLF